jgi:ubiquinone biosynthesis protein UbiJ
MEHAHQHEDVAVRAGEPGSGAPQTESADAAYEEDEVGRLREEVDMLQRQLDEAMTRLKALSRDA